MPPLSSDDRRALLMRARAAIAGAVAHQDIPSLPLPAGRLSERAGAFVTVYCRGRLRGCIGSAENSDALIEAVAHYAVSAALYDPRFPPIGEGDVGELGIEISVLSELRPISRDAIVAGTHGLMVSRGTFRGLLLPQVARERHWSAERFLEETCRKAGFDPGLCSDPETNLFGFTAEVFSEADERAA